MTTSYLECNWFKHASHRNNGENSNHLLYVALLLPQTLHCENVEISVSFFPKCSLFNFCLHTKYGNLCLFILSRKILCFLMHSLFSVDVFELSIFFFFFLLQSTLFSPSITVSEDKFSITFLYLGLKFVLSVGFELYRPFNCLWYFFLHSCELSICLNCQSLLPANFLALVSTIVGCQSFKFSSRLLLS